MYLTKWSSSGISLKVKPLISYSVQYILNTFKTGTKNIWCLTWWIWWELVASL